MRKFARIVIMMLRLLVVIALVLGIALWMGRLTPLAMHIGIGFLTSLVLATLAVLGMIRKAFGLGFAGLILAFLLPWIGLRQFPLAPAMEIAPVQVAHILIAFCSIGIGEALNAQIQK